MEPGTAASVCGELFHPKALLKITVPEGAVPVPPSTAETVAVKFTEPIKLLGELIAVSPVVVRFDPPRNYSWRRRATRVIGVAEVSSGDVVAARTQWAATVCPAPGRQ